MPPQGFIELPDGRRYVLDLKRSGPDVRDHQFTGHLAPGVAAALPATTDLRLFDVDGVVDQGQENSCTGNNNAPVFGFMQRLSGVQHFRPSRRYGYWAARTADGSSIQVDQGATIRGEAAGIYKYGMVPETIMPYTPGQYAWVPSLTMQQIAARYRASGYEAVPQTHDAIVAALASGRPIMYGFAVYNSFESVGPDGMVSAPYGSLLGYHANRIMGHNDNIGRVISRNCWGTGFGDHGDVYQRWVDILNPNYAFDFWVFTGVTGDPIVVPPTPVPPAPTPTPPPPAPGSPLSRLMQALGISDYKVSVLMPKLGVFQYGVDGVEIKTRAGLFLSPRVIIPSLSRAAVQSDFMDACERFLNGKVYA